MTLFRHNTLIRNRVSCKDILDWAVPHDGQVLGKQGPNWTGTPILGQLFSRLSAHESELTLEIHLKNKSNHDS